MRIWDLPVARLCDRHLVAEHGELHGVWSVLVHGTPGYAGHPETRRWRGKLRALYDRHRRLVAELRARGYDHRSPLPRAEARGRGTQEAFVDSPAAQRAILRKKRCGCRV